MTPFHIVIPARFQSSRLPGKVLADIGGKPMLQHTYERALATSAQSIIIATDDHQVRAAAQSFAAEVCMTAVHHQSGTERIVEVLNQRHFKEDEIIVCLQCDVPFIAPANIEQVAQELAQQPKAKMATLFKSIQSHEELLNPNVVKVVRDHAGFALYFSRSPIPSGKESAKLQHDYHVGIYAYRAGYLRQYVNYQPSPLEQMESLEQLRALYYGDAIYVAQAQAESPISVDTQEDLERARKWVG